MQHWIVFHCYQQLFSIIIIEFAPNIRIPFNSLLRFKYIKSIYMQMKYKQVVSATCIVFLRSLILNILNEYNKVVQIASWFPVQALKVFFCIYAAMTICTVYSQTILCGLWVVLNIGGLLKQSTNTAILWPLLYYLSKK